MSRDEGCMWHGSAADVVLQPYVYSLLKDYVVQNEYKYFGMLDSWHHMAPLHEVWYAFLQKLIRWHRAALLHFPNRPALAGAPLFFGFHKSKGKPYASGIFVGCQCCMRVTDWCLIASDSRYEKEHALRQWQRFLYPSFVDFCTTFQYPLQPWPSDTECGVQVERDCSFWAAPRSAKRGDPPPPPSCPPPKRGGCAAQTPVPPPPPPSAPPARTGGSECVNELAGLLAAGWEEVCGDKREKACLVHKDYPSYICFRVSLADVRPVSSSEAGDFLSTDGTEGGHSSSAWDGAGSWSSLGQVGIRQDPYVIAPEDQISACPHLALIFAQQQAKADAQLKVHVG